MKVMEILQEFKDIDKKIDVEIISIKMGKDYAKEFYNTIQGCSYGDKVQSAPQVDVVCHAAEQLLEHDSVKEQLRNEEWRHLMEYRRLMQLKLFCMRILLALNPSEAKLIQERVLEGKSWAQIAVGNNYSESQTKRRYGQAITHFEVQYNFLSNGMEGTNE